ncbi:MAG: response regulator [Pseudomonadota bacterium]
MLKVFLIEDAPRIRTVLIETLQAIDNVEVVGFAETEQDALTQLRMLEWDVVIVDIALRAGNGLIVLASLQTDGRRYGVRLVFTNHPSLALKNRSLALGADAFFDKSHEMDALISRVQEMAA